MSKQSQSFSSFGLNSYICIYLDVNFKYMGRWDGMKGPGPIRIGRFSQGRGGSSGKRRRASMEAKGDSGKRIVAGVSKRRRETAAEAGIQDNIPYSCMTARCKGKLWEDFALEYLLQRGYKVLERNWYSGRKEVDLIMEAEDGVHFVEVRSRGTRAFVPPLQTVDSRKCSRIRKAADTFMKRKGRNADVHFDIFALSVDEITGEPVCMDFIVDAFVFDF